MDLNTGTTVRELVCLNSPSKFSYWWSPSPSQSYVLMPYCRKFLSVCFKVSQLFCVGHEVIFILCSFLKKKWRHRPSWCCFGGKKPEKSKREETFLEKHVKKENLGDFTLSEYTEKVIIFGFLMVNMRDPNKAMDLWWTFIIYMNIFKVWSSPVRFYFAII